MMTERVARKILKDRYPNLRPSRGPVPHTLTIDFETGRAVIYLAKPGIIVFQGERIIRQRCLAEAFDELDRIRTPRGGNQ